MAGASLIATLFDYDHEATRKIIAKMIIVHEYPFRMVEHLWFNILMKYMNAAYQFIGGKTIRKECVDVYNTEKEVLRKALKSVDHVSLTTDLWTSNQNICYMALVANYIDENWKMQCRVLNFIELDPPHTGVEIAQAIFECITEWNIEDKVISITLDNASNNDSAVGKLKDKFIARGSSQFMPQYFHVRCCSHIVNLIVNDGLAPLGPLLVNLRETCKYFKKSPSRMHRFREVCKQIALPIGKGLCFDVPTRWSSTYKMLCACEFYKDAFVQYAYVDAKYQWQPLLADWLVFSKIHPILKALAEVTTVFSGSTYPTANVFYPSIVNVKRALLAASKSTNRDKVLKNMVEAMLEKFDKYWKEKNNLMIIATTLDPRFKIRYVSWCFVQMYGEEAGQVEEIS